MHYIKGVKLIIDIGHQLETDKTVLIGNTTYIILLRGVFAGIEVIIV